ncbi:MAG: ABC transporter substrate-binding protein [Rhodospirillales bacterium]|nr:ABC transporter substrate-binding protein [Rhodospirillales bacterium]
MSGLRNFRLWPGCILGVLTLMAALLATGAGAAALSPAEERGKQIFLSGSSPAGREITAYVGAALTALPASALPCGSCHGADGLGRPEGGVRPSNITWTYLTKPYTALSGAERSRPAYDGETVARAIAAGIGPGGLQLDVSMPRYAMDAADMADLIAYLQRLAYELDPGLSDTTISVGTLLPEGGQTASLGEAVQGVLEAYFADLNAQGGIYNRTLELKVVAAPGRDLVLQRGKYLIESGEVFALVAPFTAGLERELDDVVEKQGIPLVGPFTQFPGAAETLRRFTFYLYGGLDVQAQALAEYAATRLVPGGAKIGVVHSGEGNIREVVQSLVAQADRRGRPSPVVIEYPERPLAADLAAVAAELKGESADVLLFLGPGAELKRLASKGVELAWTPYLLTPGAMAGSVLFDMPPAFEGRIFVAYPTGPADYTRAGAEAFMQFRQRHGLPRRHTPTQIAAYASVKLLAEGLKVAGRSLSREKLVAALEKLYQFNTGLTPKLTYGPNRRIGALGAHIVALELENKAFAAKSDWIATD